MTSVSQSHSARSRSSCSRKQIEIAAGAFYIPKENELKPFGEDGHFICEENQVVGVADGVGSLARKGVDAGELTYNTLFSIGNNYREGKNIDPKLVLNKAILNAEAKGSSTACIVTLKNGRSVNYLHAVNVGGQRIRHGSRRQKRLKITCITRGI